MASRPGRKWSYSLWAALAACLGGLGCQAQVSFLDPPPPAQQAPAATAPLAKAPDRPAVRMSAKPSTTLDDAPPAAVTPAAAAQGMAIAALTGQDKKRDPAAPTSGMVLTSAQDAPSRFVPNYSPNEPPPLLLPVTLADKPAIDASAPPEPAHKPPAAPPNTLLPVVDPAPRMPLPNEKQKTTLPAYVIEPPDVLIIDGIRLIPKPPYHVRPLDVLLISVPGTPPGQPIAGPYTVTPEGTVNLGYGYGSFRVVGMTLEQAAAAIKASLRLNEPQVSVALAQFQGIQQVRGEHIVGQDGTVNLGSFGCVNVTGLTLSQAKCEIERYLSRWLQAPMISVSIGGYNSKVYYVITDGGGYGQQVYRLPITGNETVLDAISLVNGLPAVSSKRNIWLARPTPASRGCYEILPVDWEAITEAGSSETNWQIFPGDRVYVKADPLISLDNALSKVLTPVERLFGATLLGTATVQSFRGNGLNNGGF